MASETTFGFLSPIAENNFFDDLFLKIPSKTFLILFIEEETPQPAP